MSDWKPEDKPAIIPRIFTEDVAGLVAFIRATFGAEGDVHPGRPAELRIGDAVVMVSDGGGIREKMPACLYVYMPDADAAFARAVAAGATAIEEPLDTPYGDRRAMIADDWGNLWQIATYREPPGA